MNGMHSQSGKPGEAGRRRWPLRLALLLAAAAALAAVGIGMGSSSALRAARPVRATGGPAPAPPGGQPSNTFSGQRPNIVFVLTDDLSNDLVRFMPHVEAMEQSGLTFRDYFVSDSLCCPSRSSIFSGKFPHDTHVFSNVGRLGGFDVFHSRGEERHTFAVALQRAGYRTAMMGKYLNGYMGGSGAAPEVPWTYVPPGWTTWDVAGDGYPEFDYFLNEDGRVAYYGHRPSDYLTDVIARKGVDFIDSAAAAHKPFFIELASFAPHRPYTPAPRDVGDFPRLRAPRPPSFNRLPTRAPRWLAGHPPLSPTQIDQIDADYRLRAESVQAVDDMLGTIEQTLKAHDLLGNTYVVFSSDNGFHMGQYRLGPGKLTAFDTDIHVPLVVVGPGVPAGATSSRMAENIDLAPTFAALGGSRMATDGVSLVPLLRGQRVSDWRNAVLVEHRGPRRMTPIDPDFQGVPSGNPTSYEAMRTKRFLYVEYADGEREYYDLVRDPFELHNVFARLSLLRRAELHAELRAMRRCHGRTACWRAMHVPLAG